MKHWWKILCVLLLSYVLIAGLGAPLSPGVEEVEPKTLKRGESQRVQVQGYNSDFESSEPRVWLRTGDARICSEEVEIEGPEELSTSFKIPKGLSGERLDLYVSSEKGGTYLLPDAFFLEGDADDEADPSPVTCDPVVHEDPGSFAFPYRKILYESIRNLYFHVPMWFGMMGLMFLSFFYSIRHLRSEDPDTDIKARAFVHAGLLFAILGLLTGSFWARFTWGAWWVSDPKLNGAAVTTLIYFAYLILRNSIRGKETRGRVAAVYNIFAFVLLLVFLWILPRMSGESLHPGAGGNPAFSRYDLDDTMRMVFYPAVIGWFLLGYWIARVRIRLERLGGY